MADTKAKIEVAKPEKRAREGRSPAFPFVDLEKALERAEQFRLAEGKHLVPIASAKKAWKLGEDTGAARRTVAALGHFGLFSFEGLGDSRKVRLTEAALNILLDKQPNSFEREEAIQALALLPAIHMELWTKWSHELPSEATIETYLVRDRAFSSSGATDLIREYKNTLKFAKLDQSANMSANLGGNPSGGPMQPQTSAVKGAVRPDNLRMLQEIFNLSEGPVTLVYPGQLSKASYDDLASYFELFLRKAKRQFDLESLEKRAAGEPDDE
jgi:hypothetical protein